MVGFKPISKGNWWPLLFWLSYKAKQQLVVVDYIQVIFCSNVYANGTIIIKRWSHSAHKADEYCKCSHRFQLNIMPSKQMGTTPLPHKHLSHPHCTVLWSTWIGQTAQLSSHPKKIHQHNWWYKLSGYWYIYFWSILRKCWRWVNAAIVLKWLCLMIIFIWFIYFNDSPHTIKLLCSISTLSWCCHI